MGKEELPKLQKSQGETLLKEDGFLGKEGFLEEEGQVTFGSPK